MKNHPFAIHITWTTYGTWLPGDSRGYVSNTRLRQGGFVRKLNTPGTTPAANDSFTRQVASQAQKYPTVWLTREQAAVVAASLIAAANGPGRGWRILRAAVMSNHVHVVVSNCPDDGPAVRRVLKGVTQAALSRFNGSPRRWWTEDGSNRYKHTDAAIQAAVNYDANQPGMLAGVDDMRPFVIAEDSTIQYLDAIQ